MIKLTGTDSVLPYGSWFVYRLPLVWLSSLIFCKRALDAAIEDGIDLYQSSLMQPKCFPKSVAFFVTLQEALWFLRWQKVNWSGGLEIQSVEELGHTWFNGNVWFMRSFWFTKDVFCSLVVVFCYSCDVFYSSWFSHFDYWSDSAWCVLWCGIMFIHKIGIDSLIGLELFIAVD